MTPRPSDFAHSEDVTQAGDITRTDRMGYAVLPVAILCIASSSILHRFTSGHPVSVAGWRCALAAAILILWPATRRGLGTISRADLLRSTLAAILIALHFGTWIGSLRLLPVSVSILLVNTHPVFVLLFRALGGERPSRHEVIGVGLSLFGIVLMQDWTGSMPRSFLAGSFLAIAGAATLAGYLVAGDSVRQRVRTTTYLFVVYTIAALCLFTSLTLAGYSIAPPSVKEFSLYMAIAVIPTLGGHGLFAFALGHVRSVIVAMAFLAEPILATLLAIPIFHEIPSPRIILGGALILSGLALVTLRNSRSSSS